MSFILNWIWPKKEKVSEINEDYVIICEHPPYFRPDMDHPMFSEFENNRDKIKELFEEHIYELNNKDYVNSKARKEFKKRRNRRRKARKRHRRKYY